MSHLSGRKILIVEDSPVVGPFTAELLEEFGCEVLGPAPTLSAARVLIEEKDIDAAVMDIHIRNERVFPLCKLLDSKGVPFVLTSGYADWQMPDTWKDRPRLLKPYTMEQLAQVLEVVLHDAPPVTG